MKAYEVHATVTDEVCVAIGQGASNEYPTLDFVPGTSWWGALAGMTGIRAGQIPSQDFMTVFYSGEVVFSNLNPARAGRRAHPIPLSVRTNKSSPGFASDPPGFTFRSSRTGTDVTLRPKGAVDWLRDGMPKSFEPDLQNMRGWYVGFEAGPESVDFATVTRGCNEVIDQPGVTAEGQLFSRENLQSGETLQGYLRALSDQAEHALESVLADVIAKQGHQDADGVITLPFVTVGRAPGAVSLMLFPVPSGALPCDCSPKDDDEEILVTCASDTLLVDSWFAPLCKIPPNMLSAHLSDAGHAVMVEGPIYHFCSMREIAGWNGAYGRPREAETAIAAGSAFAYCVEWGGLVPAEKRNRMLRLQQRGLGLRRAEGFGEIRVNDPIHWLSQK